MENLKTFTTDNIALIEGEIMIFITPDRAADGSQNYANPFVINNEMVNVITTTNKSITGVPHIERSLLVKPDVDVHLAAVNEYWNHRPITELDYLEDFVKGYKAGYNANKKEFTREDMEKAYFAGTQADVLAEQYSNHSGFEALISSIRPLSIPSLITCNDNFENIKITW